MKRVLLTIGLGYGDEGKGLVTKFLCLQYPNSLVIRFNGGQQAGHTVYKDLGEFHMFSNFGSGTYTQNPTYWSKYCSFAPQPFIEEFQIIKSNQPQFYLDLKCPVTTHYDVLFNRVVEETRGKNRYGSCGLGFGSTMDRHFNSNLKFYVEHLFHDKRRKDILSSIRKYYRDKINKGTNFNFDDFDHDSEDIEFEICCDLISDLSKQEIVHLTEEKEIFHTTIWDTVIFEGAQGVLLDKNFGNFPFITKSNTTSKNALELVDRYLSPRELELFYVTRSYLTRHGNGHTMEGENELNLINTRNETNKNNKYQGNFRKGYLDIDLLNYSLDCDNFFSRGLRKNFVITCLDQLQDGLIPIYFNNERTRINHKILPTLLNESFHTTFISQSPLSEQIKSIL